MRIASWLALALAMIVLACEAGRAHDWYPAECCNAADCYPIDQSEVSLVPGGYRLKATGEVFMSRPTAGSKQVRWSPDGGYHRCSPGGDKAAKSSICLFAPPGAF